MFSEGRHNYRPSTLTGGLPCQASPCNLRAIVEKILVVDDEADIRRAFRRNLETDPVRIVEVAVTHHAIRPV